MPSRLAIFGGLLLLGLVVLFGFAAAQPANAASFDCNKARTPFAKAICSHPDLSKADDEVAAAFRAALDGLSEPAKAEVTKAQDAWVKFANIACTKDARPATRPYGDDQLQCLQQVFADRTKQLGNSKSFGNLRVYYVDRYAALRDPDPANDGATVATKSVSMPRLDGDDAEAVAFNRFIETDTGKDIDATIADHPSPDDGTEDDANSMIVSRVDDALITMVVNLYSYGHGAAHGNYSVAYVHYLRAARRRVETGDVFAGNSWPDKLRALALQALKDQLGDNLMLDDPKSIDDLVVDPSRWDFSPKGLIVQFEPYEVAPYAVGAPTITIAWADIGDLLAADAAKFQQ
ncbi:MAG TPA: DUF3298 domain-containing protein [Devosia sp.]|nr:DUF3298 domain-containing protein [Devosia sp.]